jgi:hypothetical protein
VERYSRTQSRPLVISSSYLLEREREKIYNYNLTLLYNQRTSNEP